jgi:hypothetical protein
MRHSKSANIQVRVTLELKAAVQAKARELLVRESDLVRFALMAAVQEVSLMGLIQGVRDDRNQVD